MYYPTMFKVGSLTGNRMCFAWLQFHNILNSHFQERSHSWEDRGRGTWHSELLSEKNNRAQRLVLQCITTEAALLLSPRFLIGPLKNKLTWRQGRFHKRNIFFLMFLLLSEPIYNLMKFIDTEIPKNSFYGES